MREREIWARV